MTRSRDTAPFTWTGVLVLGAIALGVGAAEIYLAARFGSDSPFIYVSDVLFAVTWTVSGLVAWRARPISRSGPLMLALGGLLFLNNPWGFGLPTDFPFRGLITVLGLLGFWLIGPVFAHLALSYPSGRLGRRGDRLLVGAAYTSAVVGSAAQLLVLTPDVVVCGNRCPTSPIRIVQDQALFVSFRTVTTLVFGALTVWFVASLVGRMRRAAPRRRREQAFAQVTAVIAAALFVGYLLISATARMSGGPAWLLYPAAYLCLVALPGVFLGGLFREQLAYAAVADLVRGLHRLQPAELQPSLARVLKDSNLVIMFPMGDGRSFVDSEGRWVDVPDDGSRAVTVLGEPDAPVAALLHDPALCEHRELLEAVGGATHVALENARLHAQVCTQLAEVRASWSRIVAAGDMERSRLERDLHDGAQQRLLGVGLALQMLQSQVPENDDQLLAEAQQELRVAIRELRDLAQGLHPVVLTDHGLVAAIGVLARRCPLPVEVDAHLPERPPPAVEATAYYVASEALQNVVKHASATSVRIRIEAAEGALVVSISDDGIGGARPEAGSGLRGLVDRVVAAEGSLEVLSPIGRGTTLTARIPCA